MKIPVFRFSRQTHGPVLAALLLLAVLLVLPTGFEGNLTYQNADRVRAEVLATDESDIVDTGLIRTGEQRCTVTLLGGRFRGQTVEAVNRLNGSLAQDKLFSPGDIAFVTVSHSGGAISVVSMTDHYRLDKEALLAGAFLLLLVLFAGGTGLRAILSFVDTILLMWKVLVPCLLRGWNPVWVALGLVLVLTALILSLIYGFDRRCLAAVSGAALAIAVTAVLGVIFTDLFRAHVPEDTVEEQWDLPAMTETLKSEWGIDIDFAGMLEKSNSVTDEDLLKALIDEADRIYAEKVELAGPQAMNDFSRQVTLQVLDHIWRAHITALDALRQGIYLRGYAQKQPKQEYKRALDTIEHLLVVYFPQMGRTDINKFIYIFFPFMFGLYPYANVTQKQKDAMTSAGIKFPTKRVYDFAYQTIFSLLSNQGGVNE